MIIHYNCTRQFLVPLICHPYPPSFSIFILVPLMVVVSARAHQQCTGNTVRTRTQKNANTAYRACALAQTAPLLHVTIKGNGVFSKTVLAACRFIPRCFDWKVQRFCWPKGTSLECAESIYVKTMETACVSDELCRKKIMKKKKR